MTTAELHAKLEEVDPAMAERLHPNDRRKIERSLRVWHETGARRSDAHLRQQASARQPPRYRRCVFLWVDCELDALDHRLDSRIEDMLARGLLEEVRTIRDAVKASAGASGEGAAAPDFTRGVMQAIGVRELWECCRSDAVATEEALTAMRCHTKRYVRVQLRWIRNRLLRRTPLHRFDTADVHSERDWQEKVVAPALAAVESCTCTASLLRNLDDVGDGGTVPCPASVQLVPLVREAHNNDLAAWRKYTCEACHGLRLNGAHEWEIHLKSRRHRKSLKHTEEQRRRLEREQKQEEQELKSRETAAAPGSTTEHQKDQGAKESAAPV
eukprot:TRINITY_DN1308_c1_g1_i1.p1 TRINITY_DN1308_c1_g1~~TRINITY_DN1308_c1_g1_i1.p1  ORF type:complete len:367 (+),score=131.54 TRINITY_DN1308_c1_g1_i1:121-1101(+)